MENSEQGIKEILPEEYTASDSTALIDVRTDEEWKEGRIEGAIHIPLDTIDEAEIPEKENYVLYCRAGRRSMKAAEILVSRGITNVVSMTGGIDAAASKLKIVTE